MQNVLNVFYEFFNVYVSRFLWENVIILLTVEVDIVTLFQNTLKKSWA